MADLDSHQILEKQLVWGSPSGGLFYIFVRQNRKGFICMDIVEFLETQYDCKLLEYQKAFLRDAYKERGDIRIVMRKNEGQNNFYTYLKQNNLPIAKELLPNGTTIDCNK